MILIVFLGKKILIVNLSAQIHLPKLPKGPISLGIHLILCLTDAEEVKQNLGAPHKLEQS